MFQKAVKHEAKLRLAIAGPSGSGKTFTSLAIATALANGGKIALVDTEHGSASKYADLFEFDVLELTAPFHPKRFVEAITEAGKAGYSVIILDSLTHAWSGPGGLLEIVDGISARMKSANTFAAWKDATPIQNALVEGIVAAPLHLIATMRSKQEYILTQDERGKQVPRKVGMAPQQRDGFEYEFDVFIDMDIDNTGIVQKTRCPALTGGVFKKPGADIAGILLKWLQGAPVTIEEAPVTKRAAETLRAGPTWTPEATATDASNGNGAKPLPFRMTEQGAVEWAMATAPQVWPVDANGIIVKKVVESSFRNLTKHEDLHGEALGRAWVAKIAGKLDDRAKAEASRPSDAELDGTDTDPVTAGDFIEPPLF